MFFRISLPHEENDRAGLGRAVVLQAQLPVGRQEFGRSVVNPRKRLRIKKLIAHNLFRRRLQSGVVFEDGSRHVG